MSSVEEKWQRFRLAAIPVDASQRQVEDMQNAFYGGALVLLELLVVNSDQDEDAAIAATEVLHQELRAFVQSRIKPKRGTH